MSAKPVVRRLLASDAEAYFRLRREALETEPFAFSSSPAEDRALDPEFVRTSLGDPNQALFGAFSPELVGVTGVYRERGAKSAHKARLWGLYVRASHRRRGLGEQLVQAAIAFARSLEGVTHLHLSVTDRGKEAAALYEKLGFVTWGIEPAALRIGGAEAAERHMVLKLRT